MGAEFIIYKLSLDSSLNETFTGFVASVLLNCLFVGITLLSSGSITWEITRFLLNFSLFKGIVISLNSNASHKNYVVFGIALQ